VPAVRSVRVAASVVFSLSLASAVLAGDSSERRNQLVDDSGC
jgi:hypothetical protein